ncbi:TadE/TadG family type IV pilus assembly protein [Streptomyces sp. TLI_171]|uniref:TadE/TadG family type IV pilus assembly protein n=1 Tax=Streptomyces sp. TLI_171 TaxID=1938859 RepID=UPI000C1776C3|nr:TadE/TadG family type IV pilus assembly protein [Streptomyces sp. TLI_171]RKE22586.1 TadE-like protein [Streptomyces sp. TLI_171]
MAISLAIVFPVVLFVILLVVQAGLWWYAEQAALSAAREGVEAGRVNGAGPNAGPERATEFIDRFGDLAQRVTVEQGGAGDPLYRVTVQVRPAFVVPFFNAPTITKSASGPWEKFVPQGQP